MDFRLFGPLEVFAGPAPLPIAAEKQRALLPILLLDANRSVGRDQIVDALWGEGVPAARAVRCASAIVASARDLGIEVRAGVHTGEIERSEASVRGIAVDVGARIAAAARPGEVLVSSTVKDIVAGSGIGFEDRGERELPGLSGTWQVLAAAQ